MNEQNKSYLGDGLYAHFDGYQIWLTTQQGMEVAMEPEVQDAFLRYYQRITGWKIFIQKEQPDPTTCACGHSKRDHIYEEGACRPGYVCGAGCERYSAVSP